MSLALQFNPIADCGAPPSLVSGSVQPHNTTEGSVVVFQCDRGFVPEGEMTAVCGGDGQWTPNPGSVTCSPRPTQAPTQVPTQAPAQPSTPTQTSTPTKPGENQLHVTPPCTSCFIITFIWKALCLPRDISILLLQKQV